MKVLFLTLKIFSATGGIEKVCKIAGKALTELIKEKGGQCKVYSMHDVENLADNKYFNSSIYKSFKGGKVKFAINSISEGLNKDIVILSHVNLLIVGCLIKLCSPKTKLLLFTHGIEVWKKFPFWKRCLLKQCNLFIAVSTYTKNVMIAQQQLSSNKFRVLNNCIDPFLTRNGSDTKSNFYLKKYGLKKEDFVLLTLSRLSSHDRDKGYEKVLIALKELIKQFPNLKYLIIGKYQESERLWLVNLIKEMDLELVVKFGGFVPDEELPATISLADVYVMPSTKEGFGIIFIEAMFFGKPVIAGNKDGSVDALANGELGLLVNPLDQVEITEAIKKVILNKNNFIPDDQKLMKKFGFNVYKRNFGILLEEVFTSKAA